MEEHKIENEAEERRIKKRLNKYLIFGLGFVSVLWLGTFVSNIWLLFNKEFNGATLGDSFGMVNALFSGLAFAFLIYTAFMQREELKLQRKELEDNREELKKSAEAHRELVKLTKSQNALMIDQSRFSMNINLDKLHPEFAVHNVDFGKEKNTITLIVKFRGLKYYGVYSSIQDAQRLDRKHQVLQPYQTVDLKLDPAHLEVDLKFMTIDGALGFYTQKLALGIGGWQTHVPIFHEPNLY